MRLIQHARETASLFGMACGRVAHEFRDMQKVVDGGMVWFDGVIYVAPLVLSERLRLFEALKDMPGSKGLPPNHEVTVYAPRGSAGLYAKVAGASAESAGQILLGVMRMGLDRAGLTAETIQIEIARADEGDER